MRGIDIKASAIAALLLVMLAGVDAGAQVCLTINEARDTFSERERAAALLLLTRQFELAGERVVPPPCAMPYTVSHVQLGTTIAITLSGPAGQRDATARGMDDVTAVYSQMVRSLLRGEPMDAAGIVDRTNVSKAQAEAAPRVYSDSVAYTRLGYGAMFGDRVYDGPSVGVFGYRREFDRFGIDVSFLNFQYKSSAPSSDPFSSGTGGLTGSWIKLELLRFMKPTSARSPYVGAGMSWSTAHLDNGGRSSSGSGLQGELTAGYEMGRASTIRIFVQTDASLPFYSLRSARYTYSSQPPFVTRSDEERRYVPSLTLSMGLGWQRGGGR